MPPVERRLLESIEAVGGEVDTQELLNLEREPLRLRGAGGVTATRRSAGFSLKRRAFLIPIHPNRHVVPTEVAQSSAPTGAACARRAARRSAPSCWRRIARRAARASPPTPAFLAVAMAFSVREPGGEVRPGVGTPRSLLLKLAQHFGRDVDTITFDRRALARGRPVGCRRGLAGDAPGRARHVRALAARLHHLAPRRRLGRGALRARGAARRQSNRDASPIGALREMVIDALTNLGEGRWVPSGTRSRATSPRTSACPASSGSSAAGPSAPASTSPTWPPSPGASRSKTLPALGIIDLGGSAEEIAAGEPTVRLTPRGRALLAGVKPTIDPAPASSSRTRRRCASVSPPDRARARALSLHRARAGVGPSSICSSRRRQSPAPSPSASTATRCARASSWSRRSDTISRLLIRPAR